MKPIFFASAAEFRDWLETHHASATELLVGYYKKGAAQKGLTYREAVEEALCFGWIDGVVRSIDAERYQQRFTPRRAGSIWSNVNVGHVRRLTQEGRMRPAGLAAFAARDAKRTGVYAFEQTNTDHLPPAAEKRFRAHATAWKFFSAQAPWYRRLVIHKIVNSKQPATRERWLERAIAASAEGKRLRA